LTEAKQSNFRIHPTFAGDCGTVRIVLVLPDSRAETDHRSYCIFGGG
jgi:hypothetical protein